MKFIDLFAGIGGFHEALKRNGLECVFSSEIDKDARYVYELNHKFEPSGDITQIATNLIPDHDILTAGFPCQPFSKAGNRQGFNDDRGNLFFEIIRILKIKKPKFIILENVPSLINNDDGNTLKVIIKELKKIGYILPENNILLSPQMFGVPQIRRRLIIPGVHKDYTNDDKIILDLPEIKKTSIWDIFDKKQNNDPEIQFSDYQNKVIDAWTEFSDYFINKEEIIFPIWSYEFGSDIDYSEDPIWKQKFIIKNRELYINNKKFIDNWMKRWDIKKFNKHDQKFEWNAKDKIKKLDEGLIQFRSSGLRIKEPSSSPTLVAFNERVGFPKQRRFISIEEAKKLQSLPKDFKFIKNDNKALKQLGNAVNVDVVEWVYKQLREKYG